MKKHWPRGILLGVSMALLLSGGVALAALRISIDPWCGVCCEITSPDLNLEQDVPACDPYWTVTSTGWATDELLDLTLTPPGTRAPVQIPVQAEGGTLQLYLHLVCWREQFDFDGPDASQWWVFLLEDWQEDDYGEWSVLVEGNSGAVEADFYFADDPSDCQVEEFVPEPGSILLLGTGLAGLAGYATLRWRARN